MHEEQFKKLTKLTECNEHTEAYIEGCYFLESLGAHVSGIISRLKMIREEQNRLGYLSQYDARRALYKRMIVASKQVLDEREQRQFYSCF